jgi:hypothetical protein
MIYRLDSETLSSRINGLSTMTSTQVDDLALTRQGGQYGGEPGIYAPEPPSRAIPKARFDPNNRVSIEQRLRYLVLTDQARGKPYGLTRRWQLGYFNSIIERDARGFK